MPSPLRAGSVRLRVVHLVTSTTYSGVERHVLHLSRELRDSGCTVAIACPLHAVQLRSQAAAAGLATLPAAPGRVRAWPLALIKDLRMLRAEVLHVHDGRAALLGALLTSLTGGALVRTQHFLRPASMERNGWRQPASLLLHRVVNRRMAGHVAISQIVADAGHRRRETANADVAIIAPAVSLPDDGMVADARAERSATPHPVVAFVGRLVGERRLDLLISAMPYVLALQPSCRLIMVGTGSAEAQLRAQASELGVADAVTWAGWMADPNAVLAGAHVYVNTWSDEGFGMAMCEAMALALPVVAIAAGNNGGMVESGVTGLLVPEEDPQALAGAIVEVLGRPSRGAEMGEAARERALSLYGADRTARDTLAHYERLIGIVQP